MNDRVDGRQKRDKISDRANDTQGSNSNKNFNSDNQKTTRIISSTSGNKGEKIRFNHKIENTTQTLKYALMQLKSCKRDGFNQNFELVEHHK